jgi:hypothetical protein
MKTWLTDAAWSFAVATGLFALVLVLLAFGQGAGNFIYRGF